jgi:hypothetical protein
MDLIMLRSALRPYPDMQQIIDKALRDLTGGNNASLQPYMTLHARVEPDMQMHNICMDKKERNLTKMFEMLERQFPEPPAPTVFMPIDRQYMEIEGYPNKQEPIATNWIAVRI